MSPPPPSARHPRRRRLRRVLLALAVAVAAFLGWRTPPASGPRPPRWQAEGFVPQAPAPSTARPRAPLDPNTGPCMRLDPAGGFFAWPFPSDARRLANGAPDYHGLPNPCAEGFIEATYRLAEEAPGFVPSGCIGLPFDGPVGPVPGDPLRSLAEDRLLLVDIDPGSPQCLRRYPYFARVTAHADSFRPAHLLQVLPVPGCSLVPGRLHAVVVLRSLGGPGCRFLGQHPALAKLLAGEVPDIPRGRELAASFAPLPAALDALGIHPRDVAAATVFTPGDPTAELRRWASLVARGPPARVLRLRADRGGKGFAVVSGVVRLPRFQEGDPPYLLDGGRIVVGADGAPRVQAFDEAPFCLSLPQGAMPPAGHPLYLYCHGTGGRERQAIDRGPFAAADAPPPPGSGLAAWVAPAGIATACVAGPFSPSRLGLWAGGGLTAYDFFNPITLRDNFRQMVLEQLLFLRAVLDLRIDPALCPGVDASASPDDRVRFDPSRVIVGGQSLGSYVAGMLAAVDGHASGWVLSGAGGSWIEFALGPKDPLDLRRLVEFVSLPFGERLDRFHPLLSAFAAAAAAGDNTHYLPLILRRPPPGRVPPHVLVIEGAHDLQVPAALQRAAVLALGVDFAGPEPGRSRSDSIAWALPLGERRWLPLPAGGNLRSTGGVRRTAVALRYPEDGIRHGHYVAFQRAEARQAIVEFAQAIARGEVPRLR